MTQQYVRVPYRHTGEAKSAERPVGLARRSATLNYSTIDRIAIINNSLFIHRSVYKKLMFQWSIEI